MILGHLQVSLQSSFAGILTLSCAASCSYSDIEYKGMYMYSDNLLMGACRSSDKQSKFKGKLAHDFNANTFI